VARLPAIIIFRLTQIALLPLGILGYVLFTAHLVLASRRMGVSTTVLASLYPRYMLHRLGERPDGPAARLIRSMPTVSRPGLFLIAVPTLAGHWLTGYVPFSYRYPYQGEPPMLHQTSSRITFYDQAVATHLAGADQLVILGAGFDTRAFRLPAGSVVRCFEVDEPRTQAFKLDMLQKTALGRDHATFVPADFDIEDWFEKLVASGFDPAKRSIFTWESVTMYLDRGSVVDSLRNIASTAAGTVIAFDYFSDEIITSSSPFMRYSRAIIKITGEPWIFGIDNTPPVRERVAEFVAACGLRLLDQRNFGPEAGETRSLAGFAIAEVPAK
jgi:methyltransferase (TIGR00027 family)